MSWIVHHTIDSITYSASYLWSSAVRQIGSVKGILSSMPVELTGGAEDIDTASVKIGSVGAVVEVIVSVVVMGVTTSCWEVGDPPFINGTHSTTTSGSPMVFSLIQRWFHS